MVSPASLVVLASVLVGLAAWVAYLRGVGARTAMGDAAAALTAVVATLGVACVLYALSYPLEAARGWHVAGSLVLLVSFLPPAVVLRSRARRSIPRALIASIVALFGVVSWLTLHLKGVRGGWSASEVALTVGAASTAIAAAACLGWWSKPAAGERG